MVASVKASVEAVAREALVAQQHPPRAARYAAAPAEAPLPRMPPAAAAAAVAVPRPGVRDAYVDTPTPARQQDAWAEEAHAEETLEAVPGAATAAAAAAAAAATTEPHEVAAAYPAASDNTNLDVEDYVQLNGKRKVKASTMAFRQSFAEAALQAATSGRPAVADLEAGEQRTGQWLSLRERRLTASAFSKALGFFANDRESLWEEKVGLKAPFAGNEATQWGTRAEPRALAAYEALTGGAVEGCMFRVKHDDAPHGWLGASPDGLIASFEVDSAAAAAPRPAVHGPGILEIKCPYNKGRPDLAEPPSRAIWYYMPQLQGLMDIFDREWCNLYVWTPERGSAAFLVRRDRNYWAACFDVLAEFWWAHVVPARQAHDRGAPEAEVQAFRPYNAHPASEELRAWSKRLAAEAPAVTFPAQRVGRQ